ncbi:MAG: tetratricopeptide repeat protein [Gammaproteobacteria bacterium]|nr:tetratricopeptide repeat protein [Gammaproteobacteria bacterium]
MSLINKMLAELEKHRKKLSPEQKTVLSGLGVSQKKYAAATKPLALIKLLVVLVVCAGIVYFIFQHKTTLEKFLPHKPLQAANETKPVTSTPAPPVTIKTPSLHKNIPHPAIKLENLAITTENGKTILDAFVSSRPYYYIERSPDMRKLTINLGNTAIQNNYPLKLDNTPIQAISYKQNNINAELVIELKTNAQIDTLQFYDTPPLRLELVLSTQEPVQQKITKIAIPESPEHQAQVQYNYAIQLIEQNRTQAAITQLQQLLLDFSNHVQARQLLVDLLVKNGKQQKALDILNTGLKKSPGYVPFVKSKARILINLGKNYQALRVLQSIVPDNIVDDPEYYSLLATIYHDQGKYIAAAQIYYQLTNVQPDKSAWWIGLGISLEAANKNNAAIDAYQQAMQSGDLTPELRAFLATKIKQS